MFQKFFKESAQNEAGTGGIDYSMQYVGFSIPLFPFTFPQFPSYKKDSKNRPFPFQMPVFLAILAP